jgi:hypothetical protein
MEPGQSAMTSDPGVAKFVHATPVDEGQLFILQADFDCERLTGEGHAKVDTDQEIRLLVEGSHRVYRLERLCIGPEIATSCCLMSMQCG